MQVFELHFNPKIKKSLLLDSFCYEPENIEEKKLGSLYMVGEFINGVSQDSGFLEKLSSVFRETYYKGTSLSSENALKESLKKANDFLEQLLEEKSVDCSENLNFLVLSIENLTLTLAKTGNIKIFLLRDKKITSITKDTEGRSNSKEIFKNVVTGKLLENDRIIVLTKEAFELFLKKRCFAELLDIDGEKGIKKFSKRHKKEFSQISGVCLYCIIEDFVKQKDSLLVQIRPKIGNRFKWTNFNRVSAYFQNVLSFFQNIGTNIQRVSGFFKIFIQTCIKILKKISKQRKDIAIILSLILILYCGFLWNSYDKKEEINISQNSLEEITLNMQKP